MDRGFLRIRAPLLGAALLACSALWIPSAGTAAPLNQGFLADTATAQTSLYTEVARRIIRRPGVRPGRPGVRPGRPGVRPGRWTRPARYRWRPGAAIAAGAAIGFIGAAAASWAGPAPAPGMCWYYTNRNRRQGFWDYCP